MKTTEDWITHFSALVPLEITASRWEHSLRVAEFAEKFANVYKYSNPKKAYLAGILHDITKQKKRDFHLEMFGESKDEIIKSIPEEAFHAFSATHYLRKKFDYTDDEVFSAIKSHSLGGQDMSLIQRILYASDFLASDYAAKQPEFLLWQNETEKDLSYGVLLKATKTLNNLIETKTRIFQATIDTFNSALNQSKQDNNINGI